LNTTTSQIGSLPLEQFSRALRTTPLRYRIGPFTIAMRCEIPRTSALLHDLYGDCPIEHEETLSDYHFSLQRPLGPRRWMRPQAEFVADGEKPFAPLPLDSAFPLLEWGFNWSVATTAHQFLMFHAAAVEKNNRAVLMPAVPGSGKSTLCAALVHRGWRLLSDEFGLVRPGSTELVPFPRCIPIKNDAIDVIRKYASQAHIGPVFRKTRKGDVAHVKPPRSSMARAGEPAEIRHVVFPLFRAGAKLEMIPVSKAGACIKLCSNSFNYEIMGVEGFRTAADVIDASDHHILHYSDLDEAMSAMDSLL